MNPPPDKKQPMEMNPRPSGLRRHNTIKMPAKRQHPTIQCQVSYEKTHNRRAGKESQEILREMPSVIVKKMKEEERFEY